jgi:hypothetical protein
MYYCGVEYLVENVNHDGMTGHVTVRLRAVTEENGQKVLGVPEDFGICPTLIESIYEGNPEAWIASVVPELHRRHRARRTHYVSLMEMKGKTFTV